MYQLLFVDDEPIYKLTIHQLADWESHGFCICSTASNGIEALDYIHNHTVDAIITDLQMPLMDGVNLIQAVRKEGFIGPILALSNYSDYSLVRGALTAGAFDYLLKISMTDEEISTALATMSEIISSNIKNESALTVPIHSRSIVYPVRASLIQVCCDNQHDINIDEFSNHGIREVFSETDISVQKLKTKDHLFLMLMPCTTMDLFEYETKLRTLSRHIRLLLNASISITYTDNLKDSESVEDFIENASKLRSDDYIYLGTNSKCEYKKIAEPIRPEVSKALHYINNNYMRKMSLADIANNVGMNKEYFCKVFQKDTGINLFKYISDVRMRKAADILYENPDALIKDVARLVGFDNQYFFSTKFKELYGMSPNSFRDSFQNSLNHGENE